MPLNRIAWIVTVGIALITALLMLVSGYVGYAGLFVAVGASAAINIR
jgi:ABC-type Fe3+-siderophore transport system permease subunit